MKGSVRQKHGQSIQVWTCLNIQLTESWLEDMFWGVFSLLKLQMIKENIELRLKSQRQGKKTQKPTLGNVGIDGWVRRVKHT